MRPLKPAERAAILAANPGATEADLELFEALLSQLHNIEPPADEPEQMEGKIAFAEPLDMIRRREPSADRAEISALRLRLEEMQQQLFPNLEKALARARPRRRRPRLPKDAA